jgi:hypothetical protein
VETLMRVGSRLLENAEDIQEMDQTKAREFAAEASLNFLSLLLLLHNEIPPQELSLMEKAFRKKRGDQIIFTLLVENFSSLRKDKAIREMEEYLTVEKALKEKFQAFDVARFLEMYLKIVKFDALEDFHLEEFLKATEVISCIGKLLYQFRIQQMEE